MSRGYTLVEIAIVIIVMALLLTFASLGFMSSQNQAKSTEINAVSAIVYSGAEDYLVENGEYPSSRLMAGENVDGTTMSDYSLAAEALGTSINNLNKPQSKFTPCVGSVGLCQVSQIERVYYMSKDSTDASVYSFQIGRDSNNSGCTVEFPSDISAPEAGSVAYAIAYYDPLNNIWVMAKSKRGTVNVSGTPQLPNQLCQFTEL